jgi:ribosomal protein L18
MPDLSGPLTTGVDALVDLVNERRTISFQDAAKRLRVPVSTVEAWAQFLEEEGLLSIKYSFTTPYIVATGEKKGGVKGGLKVTIKQPRTVERPETGRRAAPVEFEEPTTGTSATDSLLAQAREALSRGDVAAAKSIYDRLEQDYKDFPHKVRQEREALITTLSSLHGEYLHSVSSSDKQSEDLAATVREQLSIVQTSSSKGEMDEALNAFTKANEAFNKIRIDSAELRLSLTPLLSQAQQTILDAELANSSKSWEGKLARLNQLLDELDKAITSQQLDRAFVLYEQIEAAKKDIPPIFEERKVELENRVLPAYETLINMHVQIARREMEQKLALLNSVEKRIDGALKKGNQKEAQQYYALSKKIYLTVPNEFFEKKVEAQKKLLSYAKRISEIELDATRGQIESKLAKLSRMIDDSRSQLDHGDVAMAHDIYSIAVAEFAAMPKGFLELKAPVQKKLIDIYAALLQVSDKKVPPVTAAPDGKFLETLRRYQTAFGRQDWDEAVKAYDDMSALGFIPQQNKQDFLLAIQQVDLLKDTVSLSTVSDKESLKAMLVQVYQRYSELRAEHPDDNAFYGHVKQRYLAALETLQRPRIVLAPVQERPAKQRKPDHAKRIEPKIVPVEPVVPVEETVEYVPVGAEAQTADNHYAEAIAIWREALKNKRYDLCLKAAEVFASLGDMLPEQEVEVETIGEQAALLRDAEDLATYTDSNLLSNALSDLYSNFTRITQEHPGEKALYLHIKELYIDANKRVSALRLGQERVSFEDASEQQASETVASEAPIYRQPATEPQKLLMAPKPSGSEDNWVEAISLWHDAIKNGKFDLAIEAEDMFDELGEVPEHRAYEVRTIGEQAELLREAQELSETSDAATLRPMLNRFYSNYNDIVRQYPNEQALYTYIKSLYLEALKRSS